MRARVARPGSVLTHIYEEESDWFLTLKEKAEHPTRLAARYLEEFDRYVGRPGRPDDTTDLRGAVAPA